MKAEKIKILDCTLRDGGYVNNWEFDSFNTKRIMKSLSEAHVDIVECGFISNKSDGLGDSTLYANSKSIEAAIEKIKTNDKPMFVAMINYGEYRVEDLDKANSLQGIRLAFHKKDWELALEDAKELIMKGYKVFLQPMVSLNYSDEEFLQLIKAANNLDIYAFYIVDSFGAMRKEELIRISFLIDHNLREDIVCGFHAHNNLQLAYSNAIEFLSLSKNRDVIVDTSIFGMGRGAGNLTTELFLNYLIENFKKEYRIEPLLDIIDKYLSRIYKENYWGYSIAHYLSAIYNCHPNYSNYLVNKKTLTIPNIEEILRNLDKERRVNFDKVYIEKLYTNFNSNILIENGRLVELKKEMLGKDVYLVAPGSSILQNINEVNLKGKEKLVISVNHALNGIDADYYFFSNQKRYIEYLEKVNDYKIDNRYRRFIFTSNIRPIEQHKDGIFINYNNVLGKTDESKDNSMIMLLNLICNMKIDDVFIAGFDGYAQINSYLEENMEYKFSSLELLNKNESIINELLFLSNKISIHFITESIYERYITEYCETLGQAAASNL